LFLYQPSVIFIHTQKEKKKKKKKKKKEFIFLSAAQSNLSLYRTATLLLAVLGAFSHLYGAMTLTALSGEFDEADSGAVFGLTAYSYLSGFACLAGAVGVIKVIKKKKRNPFYIIFTDKNNSCRTTPNNLASSLPIIGQTWHYTPCSLSQVLSCSSAFTLKSAKKSLAKFKMMNLI
jgi:hypothetical protein